ncbi:hypothetical protein GF314_05165 [bacterium]|nr:hypothetical protein [bacterium]
MYERPRNTHRQHPESRPAARAVAIVATDRLEGSRNLALLIKGLAWLAIPALILATQLA